MTYIAPFLLIAFLVMKLLKSSAYKIPLIVGLAGAVLMLVYRLLSGLHMANVSVLYEGHLFVMAVAFLLMFLASRKLAKKAS